MLVLRSSILLSAVIVALMSSSSLATDTPSVDVNGNPVKVDAAKPADEKAEPAKPAVKKPMHHRIGAGEMGAPSHKYRDSWVKNSEPTTAQKAAEEARQKRLEEMHGSMKTPEKKELAISKHQKSEDALKKSQEAALARKGSQAMPKWKERALAAKKAREEKMAGHAAPKADVKKAEEVKMAEEVKKVEPAKPAEKPTITLTEPKPEPLTMKVEETHKKEVTLKEPLKVETKEEVVKSEPINLAEKQPDLKMKTEENVKESTVPMSPEAMQKEQARLDKAIANHKAPVPAAPSSSASVPQKPNESATPPSEEELEMKKNPALNKANQKSLSLAEQLQLKRSQIMKNGG